MIYLTLIGGITALLISGDFLVRGAVGVAERLGVPAIIIGLTVVAFGTSAPELVVSLQAASAGSPGIAIGNIVGSNIANILLVLGLPALIAATQCDDDGVMRNAFYMLGASILFIALCHIGPLGWWHGIILLVLLGLFLLETAHSMNGSRKRAAQQRAMAEVELIDGVEGVPHALPAMTAFIAIGLVGLPIGAHFTVESAQVIARTWGISEAAIGLTLVALGTSLPELATTLSAAMRNHCGLALGNVLGSNLFNILGIMGTTALVTPVSVPVEFLRVDLWIMLAATLAIMPFALTRKALTRLPALMFVLAYLAYVGFAIMPDGAALAGNF